MIVETSPVNPSPSVPAATPRSIQSSLITWARCLGSLFQDSHTLQPHPTRGVVFMLCGLAFYACSDALIKHLGGVYSVVQVTCLRALTRLLPLMGAAWLQGGLRQTLTTAHPWRHALRLIVNLGYTYLFMWSFANKSLTTVYTLGYAAPLCMIMLSACVLHETITLSRLSAVALGLVGVVIALHPTGESFDNGSYIILVATFLGAFHKILMRQLAATEQSLTIALYPNILTSAVFLPFVLPSLYPMPWQHWGLFLLVGMLAACAQYLIAHALRCAPAATLAPIDYSSFFWVVSLDLIFWHQIPDWSTCIGASLIVGSNLYILYKTHRETQAGALPTP